MGTEELDCEYTRTADCINPNCVHPKKHVQLDRSAFNKNANADSSESCVHMAMDSISGDGSDGDAASTAVLQELNDALSRLTDSSSREIELSADAQFSDEFRRICDAMDSLYVILGDHRVVGEHQLSVAESSSSMIRACNNTLQLCGKVSDFISGLHLGAMHPTVVAANALFTMASVKSTLGLYHEALALYERALYELMKLDGDEHAARVGDTLYAMGAVLTQLGRCDEAKAVLERSLSSRRKQLQDGNDGIVDIAETLIALAIVVLKTANKDEGVAFIRDALEIHRKLSCAGDCASPPNTLPPPSSDQDQPLRSVFIARLKKRRQIAVAQSLYDIGVGLFASAASIDEALASLTESLSVRRGCLGNDHVDVAASLMAIANVHVQREQYNNALFALQEALAIQQRALVYAEQVSRAELPPAPASSLAANTVRLRLLIVDTLRQLAGVLFKANQLDDAIDYLLDALDIARLCHGANHDDVAEIMLKIGSIFLSRGDCKEGVEFCSVALAIKRMHLGDDHPQVIDVEGVIALFSSMDDDDDDDIFDEMTFTQAIEATTCRIPATVVAKSAKSSKSAKVSGVKKKQKRKKGKIGTGGVIGKEALQVPPSPTPGGWGWTDVGVAVAVIVLGAFLVRRLMTASP